MRDCDPAGSCFEHTSLASIFPNAEARACRPLEAVAATRLGCWCRAQTHTPGMSPPVCVCSISARAAVLYPPTGFLGAYSLGVLLLADFQLGPFPSPAISRRHYDGFRRRRPWSEPPAGQLWRSRLALRMATSRTNLQPPSTPLTWSSCSTKTSPTTPASRFFRLKSLVFRLST